jgi:bacterial/archaeal transporter family-2 protein
MMERVHPRSVAATAGSLASAVGVGGLVALQAHINGRLAFEMGAGVPGAAVAALTSFGTGLLLLCLLCGLSPAARQGVRRMVGAIRTGRLRPRQLLGGTAGALLVMTQGVTVATIGVALFTVAVVAGQTSSALVVDKVGAGPAGRRPLTITRAVGAALAVSAVGLGVSARLDGVAALAPTALLLTALPLLAGVGVAWQQAFNGRVSVVGGPFPAALLNFLVGTTVLAGLAATSYALEGSLPTPPAIWWLYAGGPIGVVFISAAAVLVRTLGVLVFGLCAIAGQVVTALLVDLVLTDLVLGPLTIAGTLLTLAGVAVAAWPTRSTPTRVRASTPAERGEERGRSRSAGLR